MRHDFHRGFVVTFDGAVSEGDARGHHGTVIPKFDAPFDRHYLGYWINHRRRIVEDFDAVSLRQRLVAMSERFERAKAGETKVAEEACRISLLRLYQRNVKACGAGGQILCD